MIALWVVVGLTTCAVVAVVLNHRIAQSASSSSPDSTSPAVADGTPHHLDILFDTPPFTLTDQDAKAFDSTSLHGKVWVSDFIFTSCTSFCPVMTQQMSEFQKLTTGTAVQMVSFSVDPEHDTPSVLARYASNVHADATRWHFLTGSQESLWKISNGMKLAVGPGDAQQVMHSSHFLLVDGNGHVRGIYDFKDAGFMVRMVADAKDLAK